MLCFYLVLSMFEHYYYCVTIIMIIVNHSIIITSIIFIVVAPTDRYQLGKVSTVDGYADILSFQNESQCSFHYSIHVSIMLEKKHVTD